MSLTVWPHYDVAGVKTMAEIRELLGDGADDLNWLFASTSGVHGSYLTLDELEQAWDSTAEDAPDHSITLLVVRPRLVSVRWGEIPIERADIPWLREQVRRTLAGVAASQEGNT